MTIPPDQLRLLPPGSYVLIDTRRPSDISYGSIPGAVPIPPEELPERAPSFAGKKLILFCANGSVSAELALSLRARGHDAASLDGGFHAWLRGEIARQAEEDLSEQVERSLSKRFHKQIWSKFTKALKDYELISPGDVIGVCVSGGKDSTLLAKLFQMLERFTEVPFEARYIVMDPGYSPDNRLLIETNARSLGIPVNIFPSDIFENVYHIEKSPCYLCARMRRGHLYAYAKELGCNKIALGHHYDDVIETTLMGMLYGAQIQTMMPKLRSTNFPGMELIRPLYLVREDDIRRWRDYNGLHFLQCACRFTQESLASENEENLSKRLEIKRLIASLKKTNPDVEKHIFRSMENVCLDTVLAYKRRGRTVRFTQWYGKADEDIRDT